MGGLGGLINSITGASSSARQQNQYAVGMANLNFEQQKQMLLKGPTWQMQGYKDAGVNPMYGFGGGTLHGGGGNSAGGAGAGAQLANLSALADIYNNTRLTNAQIENIDSQTDQNEGGVPAKIFGTDIYKWGKDALNKTKVHIKERKATSAKRKKELKQLNDSLSYMDRLLYFKAK